MRVRKKVRRRTKPRRWYKAIACRLDRKLYWDPEKEEFKNDELANKMRSREMHEPWGYDKV